MRNLKVLAAMLVMAAAASFAYTSVIEDKLPKCSGKWCRDIGRASCRERVLPTV